MTVQRGGEVAIIVEGELNAHEWGREECSSCLRLVSGKRWECRRVWGRDLVGSGGGLRTDKIGGGGDGRCNVQLFPLGVSDIQVSETCCGWDVDGGGCSDLRMI